LLKLLNKHGTLSVSELADALGVTGSSVTTACKRLEKSGLLQRVRQKDGQDERVVRVSLTTQGQEQIDAWQQERRTALAQMLAPLTQPEQAELQYLLERILEHG
jgi:DNA-binding MarR family transcriptional regulator